MYLGERVEEAAGRCRRDFGGVNRCDHECITDAYSGDEPPEHEESVVSGESHEESSGKEYGSGQHYGVTPTNQVRGSSGGGRSDKGKDVEDSGENSDL